MNVVVTGGTRGIGRMLAEALKDEHDVTVVSRTKRSVETAVRENRGAIRGYVADVTDYKKLEATYRRIGAFDALINCAGVLGPVAALEETDMGNWENAVKVNLVGTVNSCKAAMPQLKKSGRGRIINVSGGGAAGPRTYHSAYAASKAAVVRFTECLAWDLAHDGAGVTANAIAPGAHMTGLWDGERFDEEPARWDDPGRLVALVKFLLSPDSGGVTGRFISIKDTPNSILKTVGDRDHLTLRRIDDRTFKRKGK